ncbi:hypothetical protein AQUCO_09100007v1 [Aquilegia coerulea]|uniref:Uncharacterized protein n=1 Tax=Aquilegia coerulea TaxID=218851 RepID=A0A2G5C5G8_AQUCA|nr:hypothetical protein AQUCO_09100007v1 [Aquilegia coerulea]
MTWYSGRRNRESSAKGRSVIFSIWAILIFTFVFISEETPLLSESLPRKARFHGVRPVDVVSSPIMVGDTGSDDSGVLFEEDKRRVHTGPNPLHNKFSSVSNIREEEQSWEQGLGKETNVNALLAGVSASFLLKFIMIT